MVRSSAVWVLTIAAALQSLLLPSAHAHVENRKGESEADSTSPSGSKLYILEEVLVASSRIPASSDRSPAPVTIISRLEIEHLGAASLSDILGMGPGLFIKDYGTASGIKTISQRGLGTEHTLVLLNGMPLNSIQNGSLDFGVFPAEAIERLEIVRGGQSASFGANAVAGAVNILTRSQEEKQVSARIAVGSFGERDASLRLAFGAPGLNWHLAGGIQKTDGDYAYRFEDGPLTLDLKRQNAWLDGYRLSGGLDASVNATLRLNATALYLSSERGVPGVVTGSESASRATQNDKNGVIQAGLLQTLSADTWWELKMQGVHAYQRYADPAIVIAGAGVDNYFHSAEARAEGQFHGQVPSIGRFTVGGDLVYAEAGGNSIAGSPVRQQGGGFVTAEHRMALSADSAIMMSIHPALRCDVVRNIGGVFSPQCGLQFFLLPVDLEGRSRHSLRIHGTAGRNFRTPTFNELYYSGGGGKGNPDLEPERSRSYDLGVGLLAAWYGFHDLDVTVFEVDMTNRIIWAAAGPGVAAPKNLRSVASKGFEITYGWSLPSAGMSLSVSYTTSRSEKRSADHPGDPNVGTVVPFTPQELCNGTVTWASDVQTGTLESFALSLTCAYVGYRYTSEDNATFLPSYFLVGGGASLGFRCPGGVATLRFDVRNLADKMYAVMPGYPMPGRAFRVSLSFTY